MDTFQFTLTLSDHYFQRLKQAKKDHLLNIGRCWFDPDTVKGKEISVKIGPETISIAYSTKKTAVQDSCVYAEVTALIETKEGIFLRIVQKGFLFLPVSDNGTDNENLMKILTYLSSRCQYVHKYANLTLANVAPLQALLFRLRKNQGVKSHINISMLFAIPLLVISLFVGTIFCNILFQRPEINREEAISLTASYVECDPGMRRRSKIRFIDLKFSNSSEQTIDGCCCSELLLTELEALPAGTEMRLLIHPVSNDVLEITVEGKTLLDFSAALGKLRTEATLFFLLGLLIYSGGIAAVVEAAQKKR